MPYADVTDVRLYFEDRGQGDPVLLVHGGLGTGAFHWRKQLDVLAEHHRVIAPDLRGLGRSSRVAFGSDVFQREAADLIALCDQLGLDRVHVVGFSAGTMPTRCLPLERPDLVGTLTLVSAADRLGGEIWDNVRHLLAVESRQAKSAQLLATLHGEPDWDIIRTGRLHSEAAFAEAGGDPTGGRLGEIRCPVLLVRGETDSFTPRAATDNLAKQLPNAEVVELAGGNHFVPQSAAEWFNSILLAWFARHPLDPAT